mgnify:CR=1 FL=1
MTNSCFQMKRTFLPVPKQYSCHRWLRYGQTNPLQSVFLSHAGKAPASPFWHWVILVQTPTVYIFLFSVLINIAEPIPPIFTLVLALSQNPITVISSFLTHRELSFQKREPDLHSYHSTNPALRIVISCEIGKSVSSVYTAVA